MELRHNTHYNFTSRNLAIRKADDVVRRVNEKYPRISKTIYEDFHHVNKHPEVITTLDFKTYMLRSEVSNRRLYAKNDIEMLRALPETVNRFKMGSCFESAELAAIAAKANGMKDFCIGGVYSSERGDLDHAVVIVNDKKTPYILDAWLGFADYIPNAIKKFQKDYRHHFDMSGTSTEKISIKPIGQLSFQEILVKLTPQDELKTIFPELIVG